MEELRGVDDLEVPDKKRRPRRQKRKGQPGRSRRLRRKGRSGQPGGRRKGARRIRPRPPRRKLNSCCQKHFVFEIKTA